MLRQAQNARRFNDAITLAWCDVTEDDFGHAAVGEPQPRLTVYAYVRQMSATKTAMTFQQADIIGVEIEFREVNADYNRIVWRGHQIHFAQPESVDNRGRFVRITGWYQIDNPKTV